MKIGINTRLLIKGKMDGIAWFSYETIRRMVANHPEVEFVFFFDRKPSKEFIFAKNVKPVIVHPQARHPLLWILFFEFGIRRALKKENIDIFLSPDGWLCLGTNVKTVNIIHDLNFEHFPMATSWSNRVYYRYFFRKFAHRANLLGTVSNFSKQDIINTYNIDSNKIFICPNAAAEDFFEISEREKILCRQIYSGNMPYFVFVGTANRRKNVINILLAYEQFRKKGYYTKLVFAGMQKYWDSEMQKTLESLTFAKDVIFTGYVSTEEMNKIISSAIALLYTSLFEGFGIPILEAFACATPVITSNTSSMPEIAADAAIKVNPTDINDICNAMVNILEDNQLRKYLILKGKERLKDFSWDRSAEILWEQLISLNKNDN